MSKLLDNSLKTRMEPKKISLFDDDDDDSDLFGAKPTKSKNEHKTDLFEDENDDLFLSAKASSIEKDTAVEPKIDVSKNVSSLEIEKKNRNDPPDYLDGLFSKTTRPRSLLFEDDDYDDLFGKKETAPRGDDRLKSQEEVRKDVAEQVQKLPEENKTLVESNLKHDIKTTTESSVTARNDVHEEKSETEFKETLSNIEEDGTAKKSSPPKTLNIRTISPPSEEHGNQQAPRRLVSGKIKNLMGKMGDLKILSPMDAPPLWRKSDDKTDEDEDVVDQDSGDLVVGGHVSPPSVSGNYHLVRFLFANISILLFSNLYRRSNKVLYITNLKIKI